MAGRESGFALVSYAVIFALSTTSTQLSINRHLGHKLKTGLLKIDEFILRRSVSMSDSNKSKDYRSADMNDGLSVSKDIVLVRAEEFAWLDLAFYDRIAGEFVLEGFSLIGDIEFAIWGEFFGRCFRRTMCSRNGTIVAEIYHQKARGIGFLFRGRTSRKEMCLTTEFSDGGIVYTVTGKKTGKTWPLAHGVSKEIVGRKIRVRDMIEIHKNKVKRYLEQNPDARALAIRSFESWVESMYRVKRLAESS